jgi:hypothetical protein
MYEDVAGTPLPDPLRRALGKPWAAHIRVKADLYGALTRLHQADVFIADDECGEQISCLQVLILCMTYLKACHANADGAREIAFSRDYMRQHSQNPCEYCTAQRHLV